MVIKIIACGLNESLPVTVTKIANSAVTSEELLSSAVTTEKLAGSSGALSPGTNGQLLQSNGDGTALMPILLKPLKKLKLKKIKRLNC